jgi:UDP-galactopyranose mutase
MKNDLICFLHLRWNFVYQRPQHLLTRFAKYNRVFIIEEPVFDAISAYNEIYQDPTSSVCVIVPHLPPNLEFAKIIEAQKKLLDMVMESEVIDKYVLWYYSPMALSFSQHLQPELIVYDCMDELSAFKFAPPELKHNEAVLFKKADIVFTGGHHLYEAKKDFHANIYPFPSSIDQKHFAQAKQQLPEPEDQVNIPHPRIGFYGVVDERFDIELLDAVSTLRPDLHFIILGPVVKIDPATLPKKENIHYLGGKDYKQLPTYLSGWDIAMMPFALNESTKYISPTKTPEYLAGGKPVISSSIRDVVIPYGELKLVHIADTPADFIKAVDAIAGNPNDLKWQNNVEEFLSHNSWDITWQQMNDLIKETIDKKETLFNKPKKTGAYV